MKNVATSLTTKGRIIWDVQLSCGHTSPSLSPQTQSGIQLMTKACDEARNLSEEPSVARKSPNLSSFGQQKNFNGIISTFL